MNKPHNLKYMFILYFIMGWTEAGQNITWFDLILKLVFVSNDQIVIVVVEKKEHYSLNTGIFKLRTIIEFVDPNCIQ